MAEGDPTAARRQLEQRGFAVVKGALPAKLIAELRSVIEDPSSNAGVGSISAEHAWNDRYQGDHLFIGFSESDMERDGATRHDVFARLIGAEGMASAFLSAGLPIVPFFWAGSVMSKPPGGPPLYWHHDWAWFDHPLAQEPLGTQLFAMVYLTKTTPENGCLRVVPGSHLKRQPLHDELRDLMDQGEGPAHGGWGA